MVPARWLGSMSIAEYGGRRDRIHLPGHSSGAHMAALLTVDIHYLAADGKDAGAIIKDFAGLAGPYADSASIVVWTGYSMEHISNCLPAACPDVPHPSCLYL